MTREEINAVADAVERAECHFIARGGVGAQKLREAVIVLRGEARALAKEQADA